MSKWQASCCAKQPPVSMGGSVPRYRARRKGCCIGRKQESIFESGAWTYILHCNLLITILCFAWLYTGGRRQEQRAYMWPGENIFFHFVFSAAVAVQSRKRVTEPHPCIVLEIVLIESHSPRRMQSCQRLNVGAATIVYLSYTVQNLAAITADSADTMLKTLASSRFKKGVPMLKKVTLPPRQMVSGTRLLWFTPSLFLLGKVAQVMKQPIYHLSLLWLQYPFSVAAAQ